MLENDAAPPAGRISGAAQKENAAPDDAEMTIIAHLEELRRRLIYALLAVAIMSAASYFYADSIISALIVPVGKLYYLQPSEAFFTHIKVAFYSGLLLASPVIFYELWRFVLPALTLHERAIALIVVPISVLLFFLGIGFAIFLVLPVALDFFGTFGGETLMPMFSIARYFDFVASFALPFGLVFELPLIIVIAAKIGLLRSAALTNKRRYVIFFSFVIGAIVTPTPDIFTQSMIALPLIILFEISLFVVKYVLRK